MKNQSPSRLTFRLFTQRAFVCTATRMKFLLLVVMAASVLTVGCDMRGRDGAPGPAGNDGKTGVSGNDGKTGVSGNDGATGTPGTDGAKGADGADGAKGAKGTPGNRY